jgi:hypothetical protein
MTKYWDGLAGFHPRIRLLGQLAGVRGMLVLGSSLSICAGAPNATTMKAVIVDSVWPCRCFNDEELVIHILLLHHEPDI